MSVEFVASSTNPSTTITIPGSYAPRCSAQSPVGPISDNGDILPFGAIKSSVVRPYGSQVGIYPLRSNKILSFFSLPGGLGVSTRPTSDLSLSNLDKQEVDDYSSIYTFKTPATAMRDQSGNYLALDYNSLTFSDNQVYSLANIPGHYLSRINWSTGEVAPIAPEQSGNYNTYTISNDGNTAVAISQSGSSAKIYNLSNCLTNTSTNQTTSTTTTTNTTNPIPSCPYTDISPKLTSMYPNNTTTNVVAVRFDQNTTNTTQTLNLYLNSTDNQSQSQSSKLYTFDLSTSPINNNPTQAYLGLGDSFSSGEGAGDYIDGTDIHQDESKTINGTTYNRENLCHTSTNSYPSLIAQGITGNGLIFGVACSGAKSKDVVGSSFKKDKPQYKDSIINPSVASYMPGVGFQIDALSSIKPSKLTIGIGGNDVGFDKKIEACLDFGQCFNTVEQRVYLYKEITARIDPLTELYKELKAASPSTVINVVGYPNIFSTEDHSCALNVHLDLFERKFTTKIVELINGAIQTAASRAGVNYIDISSALSGHELCIAIPNQNDVFKFLKCVTKLA
jgi:hypothetical protein